MFINNSRQLSSWIVFKVKALKTKAVSEDARYCLHADIDGNRFWISKESVTADAASSSGKNAGETSKVKKTSASAKDEYTLPKGFRLLDVELSDKEIKTNGTVDLFFYPQGYSDRAILHVENPDGQQLSYIIEAFLPQVQIRQEYVEF